MIRVALILLTGLAAAPATEPSLAQRTAQVIANWKPRFDEAKLRYLVADEFILAGDGTSRQLARYRDGTVLAAERALEATYFDKRPTEPIVICLFESEEPYKRLAKEWFADDDVPHFGFYRHRERVMFMNVSTGTGTLVHELTHALIAPDFPTVPDWFNEGLASLYEQCSISGDTITGLPNWRLPDLQKAIRADQLRPLKEMIEDPHFYRRDLVGINYAQARYLMFYLQQKQLLRAYYRRFRDHARDDPTGLQSLVAVIAPQTLDEFEKQWRAAVLELRFP
ncbi:MAG TPA: hypothetical protein VGI81_27340 [Tepidisphaeraceae bacterium]